METIKVKPNLLAHQGEKRTSWRFPSQNDQNRRIAIMTRMAAMTITRGNNKNHNKNDSNLLNHYNDSENAAAVVMSLGGFGWCLSSRTAMRANAHAVLEISSSPNSDLG